MDNSQVISFPFLCTIFRPHFQCEVHWRAQPKKKVLELSGDKYSDQRGHPEVAAMGMSEPLLPRFATSNNDLGVALWLCPRKDLEIHDKLDTLMGSLITLFPGQPPVFEPHITITSNIKLDLTNPDQVRDDVDRILSASSAAISTIASSDTPLVSLRRLDLLRSFFKKLFFHVERSTALVSFSQIIRELFVILPSLVEEQNIKLNPHLYTQASDGTMKPKKSTRKLRSSESISKSKSKTIFDDIDMSQLESQALEIAGQWAANYEPHLSLVYSDVNHIDKALWRTVKTRVSDYLDIADCDTDVGVGNDLTWHGGVLKLVLCEGDVSDWVALGSVDIH